MIRRPTLSDLALWAALPMAHTSRIEGRLTMILDSTRCRRALTRRILLTALGIGSAALVPLAMLRPAARAQSVTQGAAAPATLIGVADVAMPRGRWWDPNGKTLSEPALDMNLNAGMIRASSARPGQQGRLFAFRVPVNIHDPAPALLYDFRDETPDGLAFTYPGGYMRTISIQANLGTPNRGNAVEGYVAAFPASLAKTSLQLGVAGGPWREVVDCPKKPGKAYRQGPSGRVTFTLIPHPEPAARGSALFAVSDHFRAPSPLKADNDLQTALHEAENYQRAVYALDRKGKVIANLSATEMSWPDSVSPADYRSIKTTRTSHIPGDILKRAVSFRLVARPYKWVVFNDVALQPKN